MNSQFFNKEQIQNGEMQKLLDFLMSEAYGCGDHYNDIHIYPADCEAFIVEWIQLPWSHDYGGDGFVYCDEDHKLMIERSYPDNSYDFFSNEDEYKECLENWLKNHPGWNQNEYGIWYKEEDNAQYR